MTLPDCANHEICGQQGFIYIYGRFYCAGCHKKYRDKVQEETERLLIQCK